MAGKQAEAGDNIRAMEKRKMLHFHHLRKVSAIEDQIALMKEKLKAAKKTANIDGVTSGDLDFSMKAVAAEDKSKICDRYIHHGEILEWHGLIPSFEPDMFRDRMPAVERRERQGELAGLANKPRESGFSKGSDDDQAWLRGFDRSQAKYNELIVEALEEAERGRQAGKTELIKKRGRPPTKTSAAGKPIEGETPDEAKAAEKAAEKPAEAATPPKPPKPSAPPKPKADKPEEEMTNSEREALAQARAMFN